MPGVISRARQEDRFIKVLQTYPCSLAELRLLTEQTKPRSPALGVSAFFILEGVLLRREQDDRRGVISACSPIRLEIESYELNIARPMRHLPVQVHRTPSDLLGEVSPA